MCGMMARFVCCMQDLICRVQPEKGLWGSGYDLSWGTARAAASRACIVPSCVKTEDMCQATGPNTRTPFSSAEARRGRTGHAAYTHAHGAHPGRCHLLVAAVVAVASMAAEDPRGRQDLRGLPEEEEEMLHRAAVAPVHQAGEGSPLVVAVVPPCLGFSNVNFSCMRAVTRHTRSTQRVAMKRDGLAAHAIMQN